MMQSANIAALEININPEARVAIRKRPLKIPSRKPSVLIVLATPYSKPLASPSEAERMEVPNVAENKMVDRREKPPKMMVWRLVLCPRLGLPK